MILFFGPPGSGKSVQGQLLVKRNGWQWLSTGELFRHSKDSEVLQRMSTGELINDELTNRVVGSALDAIDNDVNIVIDGYPRNIAQVEWLAAHLPQHERVIDCVVLFSVPHSELTKRLVGRGRTEDSLAVIERRLAIYEEQTSPVVEWYRRKGVPVLIVDGEGSVDDVHKRIQQAVIQCQKTV